TAFRGRGRAAPARLARLSCSTRAYGVLDRERAPAARAPAVHSRGRRLDRRASIPVSEANLGLAERGNLTARAALASTAMALFLIAAKSWAAIHTSSMAMLGSLADSGLDLIASLVV